MTLTGLPPGRPVDDTPAPRVRARAPFSQATILILVFWLSVVVPRLLGSLLVTKYRASVGDDVIRSPVAILAQQALNLALLAVCIWILAQRIGHLPTDRRLSLALLIAPWVYMVCRDVYIYQLPKVSVLLYPLLILAVWALRPRLESLALLGWLIGVTSLICLVMAVVLPAKGLFTSVSGDLIAPEKQILPWGILIGIFSGGNVLGSFLALGLPAVALVRSVGHRLWILAATAFAVVWTASRSSLAAIGVMLAVFLLIAVLRASGRGVASALVLLATAATVVVLPLTAHTNEAYTNRGYIWRTSLRDWSEHSWLGLGSRWYNQIGEYVNALPGTAFHGHNLFVHSLVIGGIVYVSLLVVMFLVMFYYALAWAIRGVSFPTALLASFFVSSALEVVFGLVDHSFLFLVTILPMAVVVFAPMPPNPLAESDAAATAMMDLRGLDLTTRE